MTAINAPTPDFSCFDMQEERERATRFCGSASARVRKLTSELLLGPGDKTAGRDRWSARGERDVAVAAKPYPTGAGTRSGAPSRYAPSSMVAVRFRYCDHVHGHWLGSLPCSSTYQLVQPVCHTVSCSAARSS